MPALTAITENADLSIEYRPVASLIPYARNARTHSEAQVALIAGSIREYGLTSPDPGRRRQRHHRRPRPGAGGPQARPGLGAGDRAGAPQRGPEARLRARRQPPRRAGRLGPRAAGAGGRRPHRPRHRPRHPRLRGGRARPAAALRRARPARGGDTRPAGDTCFPGRRPLAPRTASVALRQLDRPRRRGAAAGRCAAASAWRPIHRMASATTRPGGPAQGAGATKRTGKVHER